MKRRVLAFVASLVLLFSGLLGSGAGGLWPAQLSMTSVVIVSTPEHDRDQAPVTAPEHLVSAAPSEASAPTAVADIVDSLPGVIWALRPSEAPGLPRGALMLAHQPPFIECALRPPETLSAQAALA